MEGKYPALPPIVEGDMVQSVNFFASILSEPLIERLWKFLRKKVINTGLYRNKTEFRDAIRNFFDNIHTYKKELESLSNSQFPFDKFANHLPSIPPFERHPSSLIS